MRKIMTIAAALVFSAAMFAQAQPAAAAKAEEQTKVQEPAAPELEFVVQLHVELGQTYSVGKTTHGQRTIIPITGGTFEGPDIKGEVLPGGADYQMADAVTGHTEVEAIYCIRTDDGVSIHVRNNGIIAMGPDGMYFTCAPKFEAPADSKYAWLNNKLFVCRPSFGGMGGGITLNVWMVK